MDSKKVYFAIKRIQKISHDWKVRMRRDRRINIDNYLAKIQKQIEILESEKIKELTGDE
jgi:hypothetical protein